ncbi:hypothetical protein [Gordonia sp. VNK21]|uniref:hypothetical protein n=1 Tax=Gordonia sp. VNK21 TaxID=3382483 RepID=UPI0038D48AA8
MSEPGPAGRPVDVGGVPVLVSGPVGAEPAQLAAALSDTALSDTALSDAALSDAAPSDPALSAAARSTAAGRAESGPPAGDGRVGAALLALDPTCAAGSDETAMLAALTAAGAPVALVLCRAEAEPAWPHRLEQARARLDPGRRLPVFAVSAALAAAGEPAAREALADLVRWCAAPSGTTAAVRSPGAPPSTESRRAEPAGPDPAPAPDPGRHRAERIAGARAGFTAARAELGADVRTGLRDLHRTAAEHCRGLRRLDPPGYRTWLTGRLQSWQCTLDRRSAGELDQIRAAALLGLPGGADPGEPFPPLAAADTGPEPALRPGAEDAVVLALGASAGLGLGRTVLTPLVSWAGFGVLGTLLTTVVGLALAAGIVIVRRQSARRAATLRWTTETLAAARAGLEQSLAARISAAEARLTAEIWNRTAPRCVQPSSERARPAAHAGTGEGA